MATNNKLSPEEKKKRSQERALERSFLAQHRRIFERAGFNRLSQVDGVHFEFEGIKSELDDIFVYENVVVFAEYTRAKGRNLGEHTKGKSGIFNKINEDPSKFLKFFRDLSSGTDAWLNQSTYTPKQLRFAFIHGSQEAVEDHHQALFHSTIFMSLSERSYFRSLTNSIKKSARFEIFEYLGINVSQVGQGGTVAVSTPIDSYPGIILPSEQSHFPTGFGVVSFYIDPDALLRRSYVLRRNGWRDGLRLYQRLILPSKIAAIRTHLKSEKRSFSNNIVLTLPDLTP